MKVTPAVYDGPLRMEWVQLEELVEVINNFLNRGPKEDDEPTDRIFTARGAEEIWNDYFYLTDELHYHRIIYWYGGRHPLVRDGSTPDFTKDVFVPESWAEDVLHAVYHDVARVEMVWFTPEAPFVDDEPSDEEEYPEGTIKIAFGGTTDARMMAIVGYNFEDELVPTGLLFE